MKLQLPCPISDSLLLLVVQVVLRHVAGDWGSAIPFGIEALPFPSGLGLRHSPDARRGALAEIGRVLRTFFVPSRRLKASFQRRSETKNRMICIIRPISAVRGVVREHIPISHENLNRIV